MIDPRNYFAPFIGPPGLQISVDAGVVLISGAPVNVAATNVSLAPNTTTYVYLNTSSGNISSNTSGFPSTNCYPIAQVVTSTSSVLNLTDSRVDVGGTGGGSGGVTSVFTRTGSVTAQTGDYTVAQITGAASTASPALTGTPTAPTAAPLTDNTQIATTGYTDAAVAVETSRAETAEALLAPKASPALTGVPTAPTAGSGNSSTQIATTQFVQNLTSSLSIPTSGLIAQYEFVEGSGLTTADSSGNGNNATLGDQRTITNLALTSNVATITCNNDFIQGDVVRLDGLTTTPGLNFSTTGATYSVLSSGLSSTQFEVNITHANISSGAETGTATARVPVWLSGGTGGLQFTAFAYSATPSGNSKAGGQYVGLPPALNAARSMILFIGHQPTSPTPFDNFAGLVFGNSGTASTTSGLMIVDSPATTINGNVEVGAPILEAYNNGVLSSSLSPCPVGNVTLGFNLGSSSDSTHDQYFVNGNSVRISSAGQTFNSSMAGNYQIGGGGATIIASYPNWFTGQVYYALFYNEVLTPAQMLQIDSYLQAQMISRGITPYVGLSAFGNVILSDGDSIQDYNGGWFQYNTIDSNKIGPWNQVYVSISGDSAANLIQRGWVDDQFLPPYQPFQSTPGGASIYEFMIGANDATSSLSLAQADVARMVVVAKNRRVAGWNIVMQSTMTSIAGNYNLYWNQIIRNFWSTYADILCDVASHPALGAMGANSNGNNNYYFGNGVHPSTQGQQLIALLKSRCINHYTGNTLTSGQPCVAGSTATVTNTALTSNVATITTSTNHHLQVNEWVTVTGTSNGSGAFNVSQQVTGVPSLNTFTLAITHANITSSSDSGTVTAGNTTSTFPMLDTDTYVEVNHANTNFTVYLPDPIGYTGQSVWIKNLYSGDSNTVTISPCQTQSTVIYAVASSSVTSNVVTFTGNNNFNVGDTVVMSGFTTETQWNGRSLTVASVVGTAGVYQTGWTASYSTANYGSTSESAGAIGTKTLAQATLDGGSSITLTNGNMLQLMATLITPEAGGCNWVTVNNS